MNTTPHPACEMFPMIGGDEFEALKRDIAEHGQREAILLVDGEVIDGRNRMRACAELGIEPVVRNLTREEAGDVFALVMSLNFHRRHLREHERGEILRAHLERLGWKPDERHKGGRPGKDEKPRQSGEVSVAGTAKALGIPETTARRQLKAAQDYAASSAEHQAKVDAGEITPKQARRLTEREDVPEKAAESDRPAREKPRRSESLVLADCDQAISDAIAAAVAIYPHLKPAIASTLRLLAKELTQ